MQKALSEMSRVGSNLNQFVRLLNILAQEPGKAGIHALHNLSHRLGNRLCCSCTFIFDGLDHAFRRQEARCIYIHYSVKALFLFSFCNQIGETPFFTGGHPVILARHIADTVQLPTDRLDHPQTHNIG